jgi:hypothetical protein
MILRYYVPPQGRDEHLGELIETCRQTGIKEVLLFTSPAYGPGAGFLDRAELDERLEHLDFCARRIRAAGLVFSLNVFVTLGHVYVPEEEVRRFGFWRQVGPDGSPALHPVLDPACPALRAHLVDLYEAYARLEPRLLFVDDDFGVGLNNVFHPERLKRFAARAGCEPDRDQVVRRYYSEDRSTALQARRQMRELVTADLVDLAGMLRVAVHRGHPSVRLGLMYPSSAFFDVAAVAKALAGPHRPFVRPQLPLYREERPLSAYGDALWQLNYWRAKLPEGFEILPEGENFPYTDFQKSPQAAWAHTAVCFGCGEPQVALSLNSFSQGIPAGESRRSTEIIAAHREQLALLAGLTAEGWEDLGIGAWEAGEQRMAGVIPGTPVDMPRLLGLPIRSARRPQEALLHWGQELYDVPLQTLDQVLANGAVLDLESAALLQEVGLQEMAGFALGAPPSPSDILNLRFIRQDGSPEDWPIYYFIRAQGRAGMPHQVKALGARVLLSYHNDRGQASLPFALTWAGPRGRRFALINAPMRLWPRYALLNPWMGGVLAELCQWVSGRPLPARVVRGPNVALQALRLRAGDRVLLTLVNYSTSSQPEICIALDADLATCAFSEVLPDGRLEPVAVDRARGTGGLQLGHPTESLGVRFLLGVREQPLVPFSRAAQKSGDL